VGGKSYLLPVDQDIQDVDEVAYKAMDAESVLAKMQSAGNSLNLVFLDACRNNPFPGSGRSGERGLAVVKVDLPESVIVYAAEPGKIAADGDSQNSPFTKALLKNMTAPGTDILAVMKKVKAEVASATGGQQSPRVDQNLSQDFAFYPTSAMSAIAASPAAATPTVSVAKSYGSLVVSTASAGALYLDGAKVADLGAGDEASIDKVQVGARSLELRHGDGQTETQAANVNKGQASSVVFSYKSASPKPAAAVQQPQAAVPAGFVFVPGGSFTMGSPANEVGRGVDEVQHQVTLSGFYISATEVTQAQYQAVMGNNPSEFKGDTLPVEHVSWNDAVAYCNTLSEKEGLSPTYTISGTNVSWNRGANGYRLLTEAEWEFAARGGGAASNSLAVNAVYAGSANLNDVAWYSGNSGNKTHPVGQKAANGLGLYDMSGNVWEWCWDWYGGYSSGSQSDPLGPASGSNRVIRGGSWRRDATFVRSANRDIFIPAYRYDDFIGFRVLRPQSR
jgi:formylglycine-generating enzyme required for sulfatase activity